MAKLQRYILVDTTSEPGVWHIRTHYACTRTELARRVAESLTHATVDKIRYWKIFDLENLIEIEFEIAFELKLMIDEK